MSFQKFLQFCTKLWTGIKMSGGNNATEAIFYSWKRRAWNALFDQRQNPHFSGCGTLLDGHKTDFGLCIEFRNSKLQIEVLAPNLVRMTWGNPSNFPSYGIEKKNWDSVPFSCQSGLLGWKLETSELKIIIGYDGVVKFFGKDDKLIFCALAPEFATFGYRQCSIMQPMENFYGLGERACGFNLRSKKYRLWNRDPGGIYWPGDDPLYLCMPVYMGQHKNGTYLIFYENTYDGQIDFGAENANEATDYASAEFTDGPLRYYFITGTPKACLERFTELTGRPPLPPRWALGYHQSLIAYETEKDLEQLYNNFARHKLPLSAIHLDLEFMDGFRIFTIDTSRFPHFKDIAEKLLEQKCRLIAIVDAGVKDEFQYWVYQSGLSNEAFCALPNGELASGPVWPGKCVFPDFSKPEVRRWWQRLYPFLLYNGISGVWHDMNEPAIFSAFGDPTLPLPTRHSLEHQHGDHRGVHNVYALLENWAGYEGLRNLTPEQRPFILTRSGWVGIQRYAWKWTGDTACTWENLKATVATVLGAGLCGIAYDGPDIGGFNGTPTDELYIRWFQLAAFLPFFRGHGAFITPKRCPWDFGEPYLTLCRSALQMRYQLLPYLYTTAWQASQKGYPIARPMFWEYPEQCIGYDDAFFLGDSLLVVPITEENMRDISISLPPGTWYLLENGKSYTGNAVTKIPVNLHNIPVLVKGGTVLPLELDEKTICLHVYPQDVSLPASATQMYSDIGDGYGSYRVDTFQIQMKENTITIAWEQQGEFPWPYPSVYISVHGYNWKQAVCDGIITPWQKEPFFTSVFQKICLEGIEKIV